VEKIRRLALLIRAGIEEYDEAVKVLQEERLKYLRLSMTESFGDDENSSRGSWLAHLKALEVAQATRLNALRQAIVNAAVEIQADLPGPRRSADTSATASSAATESAEEPEDGETPSDADKV
jgi:hypothetical protein